LLLDERDVLARVEVDLGHAGEELVRERHDRLVNGRRIAVNARDGT